MFGIKKEEKPQGRIDSLIGAGTRLEGSVVFSGSLRIDGEVKGDVSAADAASTSILILSEQGRIEGNVRVARLVTNGHIVGLVSVSDSLEMQSRAKIIGDVDYASIEMHLGAVIDSGRLFFRSKMPEQKELSPD